MRRVLAFLLLGLLAGATARAAEGPALTLAGDGQALVREVRVLEPAGEPGRARLTGLPAGLDPASLHVRGLKASLHVERLFFDPDPVQAATLLSRLLGREVRALLPDPADPSRRSEQTATLLSAGPPLSLLAGGRVFLAGPESVILPAPEGAAPGPLLTLETSGRSPAGQAVELTYLCGGLTWSADYALELDASGQKARLTAWATLANASGRDFPGASVRLLAGERNRVNAPLLLRKELAAAGAVSDMAGESAGEYHLYSLPGPVDLRAGEVVRVSLLRAESVAVRRELVSRAQAHPGSPGQGRNQDVQAVLRLRNARDSGLGLPLPGGLVRIYEPASGGLILAGEDHLEHSPRGRDMALTLGRPFDFTVERRVTALERRGERGFRAAWEIRVQNASDRSRRLVLDEVQPGAWTLIEASRKHSRPEAQVLRFELDVPPTGDGPGLVLTYSVDVEQ